MLREFGKKIDTEINKEEKNEGLSAETIAESKVEKNNSKINNTTKVNGLTNVVKEYVQSHDMQPAMKEIIENMLFQASETEVSYACLCQVLFSLQDQGLTEVIGDFTTSYEV